MAMALRLCQATSSPARVITWRQYSCWCSLGCARFSTRYAQRAQLPASMAGYTMPPSGWIPVHVLSKLMHPYGRQQQHVGHYRNRKGVATSPKGGSWLMWHRLPRARMRLPTCQRVPDEELLQVSTYLGFHERDKRLPPAHACSVTCPCDQHTCASLTQAEEWMTPKMFNERQTAGANFA